MNQREFEAKAQRVLHDRDYALASYEADGIEIAFLGERTDPLTVLFPNDKPSGLIRYVLVAKYDMIIFRREEK